MWQKKKLASIECNYLNYSELRKKAKIPVPTPLGVCVGMQCIFKLGIWLKLIFFYFLFFTLCGAQSRDLYVLSKHSTTVLQPQSTFLRLCSPSQIPQVASHGKDWDHWSELLGFQILTFCARQLNYSLMPSLQGLEWRREQLTKPVTHITWSPNWEVQPKAGILVCAPSPSHGTLNSNSCNSQGLKWIVWRRWKFSLRTGSVWGLSGGFCFVFISTRLNQGMKGGPTVIKS